MPQKPRGRGSEGRPSTPPEKHAFPDVSPRNGRRLWIWAAALLGALLVTVLILLGLRPTSVTVVPRSHVVLFDESSRISASSSASPEGLLYRIATAEFEDSEVVPTTGVERVEERASGTITVFNNYSTASVKLIKNTRFETPEGLIFRTPSEIVIPGKKGGAPGQVSITVMADKPGEAYNVGPVARFTVPGLVSTPAMFSGIYASSKSAFSGGFSGERPAALPGAVETARSAVRERLLEKARESAHAEANNSEMILSDLSRVTYQSLPATSEAGGGMRIHEKARIEIPVFSKSGLAKEVAKFVSADAEISETVLVPGKDFKAEAGTLPLTDRLDFKLSGTGTLVWVVDAKALTEALAGREEGAFQTIVGGFPSIEEARARVEPFWKSSFPADPTDITVRVEEPKNP